MEKELSIFFKNIGITPKDLAIYKNAFTHTSFVNENSQKKYQSNERLEFYGDSILGFIVSNYIYRKFKTWNEGELSMLRSQYISGDSLANIAKSINLDKVLYLGKGQSSNKISKSILATAMEALIAAIYLDQGLEVVTKFLDEQLLSKIVPKSSWDLKDYKTKLQELLNSTSNKLIKYEVVNTRIKNSLNYFEIVVKHDDVILGKGKGYTKKEAEQEAAKEACNKISIRK